MSLSETLIGLIHQTRLTYAAVARQGGLSRNTLYDVRDGEIVGPDTLRKIARGLAIDPHTGDFDPSTYAEAVQALFDAGGYTLPEGEIVTVSLEDEVTRLVRSRATAEQIIKVLERFPELHPDKRTLLMAAIRNAIAD